MPTTIDATIGGPAANSYGTQAEGVTYFGDRMHTENWDALSGDDQIRVLLWAAKILDTRVRWKGAKTLYTQALSWPRVFVPDPEYAIMPPVTSFSPNAAYLDSTTIPNFIKWAQFEQALALAGADITIDPLTQGFSNLSVGPITVAIDKLDKQRVLPRAVRDLIAKYGEAADGGAGTSKLLRA